MSVLPAASAGPVDAIAILTADHESIKKKFRQFRSMCLRGETADAQKVARRICRQWTIHTTIEEEIFYPEARAALANAELVDDTNADRAMAKELMAQIIGSSIADDRYAARVGMLAEYVNHHIREEQEELFPQARRCGLDMDEIGSRMLARRLDLEAGAVAMDDAPTRRGSGRQDGGRRTAGHG
jgi:hypothetical protein